MSGRAFEWLASTRHRLTATLLKRLERLRRRTLRFLGGRLTDALGPRDTRRAHMLKAWIYSKQRQWDAAEQHARAAVTVARGSASALLLLAKTLRARSKLGQETEIVRELLRLRPRSVSLHYQLGLALQKMNLFEESSSELALAVRRRPRKSQWWYRLAYSLDRAGRGDEAKRAYDRAVSLSRRRDARALGAGVMHEQMGYWPEAAAAYAITTAERPSDAQAHARLGRALMHCHRWDEAAASLRRALDLAPDQRTWRSWLGLALEQDGKWLHARDAYVAAMTRGNGRSAAENAYRAAFCLRQAGRFREGCELLSPFVRGRRESERRNAGRTRDEIVKHGFSAKSCQELADLHYGLGEFERSVQYLRLAVLRDESHSPELWAALGRAWLALGREDKALDSWLSTRILQRPALCSGLRFEWDFRFRRTASYTEYVETLPIEDELVLYESYHGRSVSCNPLAIFRELLENPHFHKRKLVHVWGLNDPASAPLEYRRLENVVFVKREGDAYLRVLATAKYLVNNTSFSHYFIRRPEQIYLQTWHGTPIKALGVDVRSTIVDWRNISRNLLHATHLLTPNDYTTRILIERQHVAEICRLKTVRSGYPRLDLTLRPSEEAKDALRRRLGAAPGMPIVLYAPTFREQEGKVRSSDPRLTRDAARLARLRCRLLFRGHYFQESALKERLSGVSVVPSDVDTNALLSVVDILVTDYSSIAIDFLVTQRPIIHYVYDSAEYIERRGLSLSLDALPGDQCLSIENVVAALQRYLEGARVDETAYAAARQRFCPWEDGRASWRAARALLGEDESCCETVEKRRQAILSYGGKFLTNGITISYLSMLAQLDSSQLNTFCVVEPDAIRGFEERVALLGRIPEHVQLLGRYGPMNLTCEEKRVVDYFASRHRFASGAMRECYLNAFRREAQRLFGYGRWDRVVNFDGYGHYWAAVLGVIGEREVSRRVIYQHNDMVAEWKRRFPSVECAIHLYDLYDAVVSVSEDVLESNRRGIAAYFELPTNRFVHCDNLIDPDAIRSRSDAPLERREDEALFVVPEKTFVTVGRLSPEKGHARLLEAFARLLSEHPDARLVVVGDGPCHASLLSRAAELGIAEAAHFLGQRANPYPYIRGGGCFVLASEYEGQGLVLLEALVLERPIVCTRFAAANSVLSGTAGLIVDNSADGLAAGMSKFIRGELSAGYFDSSSYVRDARAQLYANVLGMPVSTG